MLRESSQTHGENIELSAVMTGDGEDVGIEHGVQLVAIAEALVSRNADAMLAAREALISVAGSEVLVDAVGVASNFQRMVRIADSTGIVLGNYEEATAQVRSALGINAFQRGE